MKSPDSDTRQRGIILIVVLWTVASLSLLLSTINVSVRTNNAVARAELITAKLESLADAGVELAVARLHARGDQRWLPNGQPYDVSFGGAALRIRITDANGLVDLNKADAGVLFAVFKTKLGSDQKAVQLRDWVLAQRASATASAQRAIGARVVAGSRTDQSSAFIHVDDLLRNGSMNVQMLNSLRDVLTVHSRQGKINPVNASEALLTVLPGVGAETAAAIVEARARSDKKLSLAGLVAKSGRSSLKSGEGPAYRITVDVSGAGFAKPVTMTAVILVGTDGDAPYYGLSWEPFGF